MFHTFIHFSSGVVGPSMGTLFRPNQWYTLDVNRERASLSPILDNITMALLIHTSMAWLSLSLLWICTMHNSQYLEIPRGLIQRLFLWLWYCNRWKNKIKPYLEHVHQKECLFVCLFIFPLCNMGLHEMQWMTAR